MSQTADFWGLFTNWTDQIPSKSKPALIQGFSLKKLVVLQFGYFAGQHQTNRSRREGASHQRQYQVSADIGKELPGLPVNLTGPPRERKT